MIACPCCQKKSRKWDVWYDCPCFQGGRGHQVGGNEHCENCARPREERDAQIAATMRAWGWDQESPNGFYPSPFMRDFLTPGWRVLQDTREHADTHPKIALENDPDGDEFPF
jgi:hypothetical protein